MRKRLSSSGSGHADPELPGGSPEAEPPPLAAARRQLHLTPRLLLLGILGAAVLALGALGVYTVTQQGRVVATASGARFHPLVCSAAAAGAGAGGALSTCDQLSAAAASGQRVTLPAAGLKLASGDRQLGALASQLEAAVADAWPLALSRRLMQLALAHVGRDGVFTEPPVSDALSGHARGWKFVRRALQLLAERGADQLVPCQPDPSLPTGFKTRFLFAGQ
jgi:hypothetical protein